MPDYNIIINYFDGCINHYKELLSFENQKLSYVLENNISELANCLSREQALIMKGNSLESRRVIIIKEQGFAGKTFAEISKDAPQEYTYKLSQKFDELSRYVLQAKKINEEALDIVKKRLNYIESKSTANSETYNLKGDKKHSAPQMATLKKNI